MLIIRQPNAFWILIFLFLLQLRASDFRLRGKSEKFNLRITERETNFVEQVEVDEDNDIEYFTVPAHNDVLGADFLFDFKMVRSPCLEKFTRISSSIS